MNKILTLEEALQDGNIELIEDALDQFNDRGIVDERLFTELRRACTDSKSAANFIRLNLQKGRSRFVREPAKITIQ